MTKRKKKGKKRGASKRLPRQLEQSLAEAMELYEAGEIGMAQQQLLLLIKKYPHNKLVLLALTEVSGEVKDWPTVAYYSERLLPLEEKDEQAQTLNNLIYAHIQMVYPALAWYYAEELLTHHPNFESLEPVRELVELTKPMLLEEISETIGSNVFSTEEELELRVLHDRVKFYTESGYGKAAIKNAEAFLARVPGVIPILNNLSLAQFISGMLEQAIATAQQVLAQAPDNFHALGNLVRYYFLTAQFDEAQAYATRLQQVRDDQPDIETKQAEAFAFLGDDEQVWAAYERAKTKHDDLPPLLLHLAAAASYRLGNQKRAWRLWQQAVKLAPAFVLAEACLAAKKQPPGERDIAWYWPFRYWFSQQFEDIFEKHLGRHGSRLNERRINRAIKAVLAERPYLLQLLPAMLDRGDQQTREFAFICISLVETPDLLQALYDFAQSPYGTDGLRLEVIQMISQEHPHLLPEDRFVPMWVDGTQTDLFMIDFEITDEPKIVEGVSEANLDKHERAVDLLLEDDLETAESMLQEIIAEAPHFYSVYNHLALIYERQGRQEEAQQLMRETHERFPDYFFGRVGLARLLIREKKVEEARALVKPLLRRRKLHISEFRALARTQMDIELAADKREAARSWLEMWQQIEPDHPELDEWEMRLTDPKELFQMLQQLMDNSQKEKQKKKGVRRRKK